MTFLPLIGRELRARARSRATFWVRFGVVLAGAIICLPELLSQGFGAKGGRSAESVYYGIVVVGFLLACGGCLLTADMISRERREGTLGLLFLTKVRRLDLLLGKFGSGGLSSVCALTALMPLMMIPVLTGGVTGGEAFRIGLGLLNMLFLALAVGLWASTRTKEMSRAIGSAIRVLAALVLLPELLELFGPAPFPVLGPINTLIAAGDSPYKHSAEGYWISLLLVHIAGWAFLMSAGYRLRTAMQEGEVRIPDRFTGDGHYQSLKRKWPLAWMAKPQQPIEFLVKSQRGINGIMWAAALMGLILYFGTTMFFLGRWLPTGMVSGALFAWAASRFAIEARRSDALELLLTTPLGAQKIMTGQWDALKQLLRWPVLLMLFPYLFQIMSIVWRVRPGWSFDLMVTQWAFLLLAFLNMFFGIAALCWTGLWFGIRARNQAAAILWTVALAKGVPYFISLISQGLFAIGIIPTGMYAPYDVRWYIPSLLSFLFYIRLMFWVRARLLTELPDSEPLRFSLRREISRESFVAAIQSAQEWRTH